MKALLLILPLLISCQANSPENDDYVLIEFASKLEEDYQKLSPIPASQSDQNDDLKKN